MSNDTVSWSTSAVYNQGKRQRQVIELNAELVRRKANLLNSSRKVSTSIARDVLQYDTLSA